MGGDTTRNPYTNVVGIVSGTLAAAKPGFFLLGAHLDATAQRDADFEASPRTLAAPGADDNGSGLVTLLEVARVMGVRGLRPEANLVITFFDGEEQQLPEHDKFLLGSEVMAGAELDTLEESLGPLLGFVNLDMVAYNPRRDSLVVLTNITSRWLADEILTVQAAMGVPESEFMMSRDVAALTYSDHAPFWRRGRDAVLLIENPAIEQHAPHYHRHLDTVANTYSRGGSQVVHTAEMVLALVASWSRGEGTSDLRTGAEDIFFRRGSRVDLDRTEVGRSVTVAAGVVNLGATRTEPWRVRAWVEIEGRTVETFAAQDGPVPLPAGGHARLYFDWIPTEAEAGEPVVRVAVEAPGDGPGGETAGRALAVEGQDAGIRRAYVYPNPTRSGARPTLHYELTRGGPMRLELLDLTGRQLEERVLPFDPVAPAPGVGVGAADLDLGALFRIGDLAPGLYLIRLELFNENGVGARESRVTRWALVR